MSKWLADREFEAPIKLTSVKSDATPPHGGDQTTTFFARSIQVSLTSLSLPPSVLSAYRCLSKPRCCSFATFFESPPRVTVHFTWPGQFHTLASFSPLNLLNHVGLIPHARVVHGWRASADHKMGV